jgi:hypothetical protein
LFLLFNYNFLICWCFVLSSHTFRTFSKPCTIKGKHLILEYKNIIPQIFLIFHKAFKFNHRNRWKNSGQPKIIGKIGDSNHLEYIAIAIFSDYPSDLFIRSNAKNQPQASNHIMMKLLFLLLFANLNIFAILKIKFVFISLIIMWNIIASIPWRYNVIYNV